MIMSRKRKIVFLIAVIILIASVAYCYFSGNKSSNAQTNSCSESFVPSPTPVPTPNLTKITFSATGDNLIHNGIYEQAKQRAEVAGNTGYDFSYCYKELESFYKNFDINWINQETLITDILEPSTYPCFSTPGDMGRTLYDLGFRVFNLSNNHTYDKGATGIEATLEFWNNMPNDAIICGLYEGEENYNKLVIQEKNGIKISYLAYTEHTNGIKTPSNAVANVIYTNELDIIKNQIQLARQNSDVVIVSVHWGVEGSHEITQNQINLANKMANWGADVIIGTHPHVIQNADWIETEDGRKTLVAYSLGNFLNAQSTADTMIGAILTFEIEKREVQQGEYITEIKNPKLIPTVNHYEKNYMNIRMYLMDDYTDELAQLHGVRTNFPGFDLDYIKTVVTNTIDSEFLEP